MCEPAIPALGSIDSLPHLPSSREMQIKIDTPALTGNQRESGFQTAIE